MLLLNGALGFWQELRAERAIRALSEAFTHEAVVLRDGCELRIPAAEVVEGDVLVLQDGERVAADGRVASAYGLELDESALAGESLPVTKQPAPVPDSAAGRPFVDALQGDRRHAGARPDARVRRPAPERSTGRIEELAAQARPPRTPLERRLARLATQLVAAGGALTVLLTVAMLLRGADVHAAFLEHVAGRAGTAAALAGALVVVAATVALAILALG